MFIPGPGEYLKANLIAFLAGAVTVVVVHVYAKIVTASQDSVS